MKNRYTIRDIIIVVILAVVTVWLLQTYVAGAQAPAAAICDISAPEMVFRDCVARQASAALELRSEVWQLNNRIAVLESRSVQAGISRDDAWKLANDAAYSTLCKYKVLTCR